MTELTQEQRTNIAVLASEAVMQGLDLMVVTDDRNRLLTALKTVERDHIVIHPEFGKSCEWCGGETGHMDDCPFAVIALVEDCDHDLPEPLDDERHAERMLEPLEVVLADLAALRALLAGAVPLLELAAVAVSKMTCEHCPCVYGSASARYECSAFHDGARDTWPCYTAPTALRELAQGLRALATVPEVGAEAEAGEVGGE